MLSSDLFFFMVFWFSCSCCVLNVVDMPNVDLDVTSKSHYDTYDCSTWGCIERNPSCIQFSNSCLQGDEANHSLLPYLYHNISHLRPPDRPPLKSPPSMFLTGNSLNTHLFPKDWFPSTGSSMETQLGPGQTVLFSLSLLEKQDPWFMDVW